MKRITEILTKAHCRMLNNEKGAAMIEYVLIVGGVVALATALIGTGGAGDAGTTLMGALRTKIAAVVTAL